MTNIEIVAEVANAHQGDPELAIKLAKDCLAAGADAVKFQVYFAHELLVRSHPRFEHFRKQSFSATAWEHVIGALKSTGAPVYCDVFGLDALKVALNAGADGFKIHSSDLANSPLLQAAASAHRRIFLSTGGSSACEIAYALTNVREHGVRPVLLHGFQSYPTAVEDSRLSRLEWLAGNFGQFADIGYQDHVAGDDPFAVILPILAIGMGAQMIEKHVTLDRGAQGVDYYSSLEPSELADFVATVRRAERARGAHPAAFSVSERNYRDTVKKHWVASADLPAGRVLELSDLVMKRVPGAGAGALELEKLIGRELLCDVHAEHAFTRADVRNTVWAMVVARMRSSRLPGKALLDVAGMPALRHLLERLKQSRRIDKIVFCTTVLEEDEPLAELASAAGVVCCRGPVEDVLARMLGAIEGQNVDVMLRVTGDDILVDPEYADIAIAHHLAVNAEYTDLKALPSGTEVELFDAGLMKRIHLLARDPNGTEYLTNYVTDHPDQFRTAHAPIQEQHARNWRLTLDTPEDYEVIHLLLKAMRDKDRALTYRLDDIVEFFESNLEVLSINSRVRQRQAPPDVDTVMDWRRLVPPAATELGSTQ